MKDFQNVKLRDVEISYRDTGPSTSTSALVFLHAFPLNQTMWDEQVAAFSTEHRVVTLDWRGFGGSTLGERPSRMDVFADDLKGLLSLLGIDTPSICGLSMGGYALLAALRKFPSIASRVVFADTRAAADTAEGKENRMKMAARVRESGSASLAEDLLVKLLGKTTRATSPDTVARIRALIERASPEAIAHALLGMAEREDSTDFLSSVHCPTLVIVGSEDDLTPPDESKKLSALIEGSQLEIIEGAGHLSNLEKPAEFNDVLRRFLSK
jgi:Predicted hydrolases or acyltransferases (alpha/beta hydrolase superfamily)